MKPGLPNLCESPTVPATRRSIFGNYRPPSSHRGEEAHSGTEISQSLPTPAPAGRSLQQQIDTAVARAFLHRVLAKAFEDPEPESWALLRRDETLASLRQAATALGDEALAGLAADWHAALLRESFEDYSATCVACFGHTVRGDCPLNEIEYRDLNADPLFQPHRLADLGAFYAAFGLELAGDAGERIDHVSIELEFLSVLAAKEAYALEHQEDTDELVLLRDAQRQFLREHLGRWAPAFALRLARRAAGTALGALAAFAGHFIRTECARHGVTPGGEDLALRPVNDAIERLCDSCGLAGHLPGAAAPDLAETT
jgi:putative dimethyl sulfoxide reductase chaperone